MKKFHTFPVTVSSIRIPWTPKADKALYAAGPVKSLAQINIGCSFTSLDPLSNNGPVFRAEWHALSGFEYLTLPNKGKNFLVELALRSKPYFLMVALRTGLTLCLLLSLSLFSSLSLADFSKGP